MGAPASRSTLRQRWEAIAPELAGHAVAVGFEADSGRLSVCPESAAWATKVRLEQARIVEAANVSADRTVSRSLRILAPGSASVSAPDDVAPQTAAAPNEPVRTRELASNGYHRDLAAHLSPEWRERNRRDRCGPARRSLPRGDGCATAG
ncbi:DUF721 domain-containing protein [Streptomyces sp. NPDC001100]